MKYFITLSALACICLIWSCEPDLPINADYQDYVYSGLDPDGGSWTPILLSSPDAIQISAPDDVSSTAYMAELAALKSAATSLGGEKADAVNYWTNNPVVRWNEIALDLAAKYNLIPAPNADGSYTLPNPANPGVYPYFPFAHPPYTVRMLSYLSVAQFDGLITAWHYKYQYGRPSPQVTDPSVPSAYVVQDLPSYPSDGAVVAIASRDILKAMFPLEADFLNQKAEEHLNSLMWAGVNVQSDIDAGETIGSEIARIALERAKADGMSKAQCSKPVSDSIKAAAFARFGWQWDNLETPVRPVGLCPLYGQVRTWNLPSVELTRSKVPPAPGSAEFEESVAQLKEFAKTNTEEHRRIANFWQDGLGTYTPPGHWNKIATDYIVEYAQNPLRTARTLAYLNMAMMDGGISCWDTKYYYHYPRPIQTIPGYETIAGTPNFPSYTSGHSVFSAAAAEVLSYVFPAESTTFRDWALEAAISRVYGGIHYNFDATEGTVQGIAVAAYTVDKAKVDGAD